MRALPLLLTPLLIGLGGCSSLASIAGVISGAIAGGATANPAVGFAVGVGTDAAFDYGQKYYDRVRARAEQNEIATLAGSLAPGGRSPWAIRHTVPIGNEHGTLQVMRDIANPLAPCKEVAFSVDDDDTQRWYHADVCQQPRGSLGDIWAWASAEPAVARWGYLQRE